MILEITKSVLVEWMRQNELIKSAQNFQCLYINRHDTPPTQQGFINASFD